MVVYKPSSKAKVISAEQVESTSSLSMKFRVLEICWLSRSMWWLITTHIPLHTFCCQPFLILKREITSFLMYSNSLSFTRHFSFFVTDLSVECKSFKSIPLSSVSEAQERHRKLCLLLFTDQLWFLNETILNSKLSVKCIYHISNEFTTYQYHI